MVLKSVTEVPVDFQDVRAVMLRTPREWLEWLASEAGEAGDRLVLDVGLDVAGRHVGGPARLEIGEPLVAHRVVMLPVRFRSLDHRRLFPEMDGSLDVAWLGHGRTYVALGLTYDPPLGLVGRIVDRTVLNRVAETVAQRFVESVAHELMVRARGHHGAGAAGSGPAPYIAAD